MLSHSRLQPARTVVLSSGKLDCQVPNEDLWCKLDGTVPIGNRLSAISCTSASKGTSLLPPLEEPNADLDLRCSSGNLAEAGPDDDHGEEQAGSTGRCLAAAASERRLA